MMTTVAIFAAASMSGPLTAQAGDDQSGSTAVAEPQHAVAGREQDSGNGQVTAKGIERSSGNMVLIGELVDTRDVTLKGVKEEKHRLLKVKPGNGSQVVIVDIGTQSPAASFGLMKGDRVIAVGKSARINDRPVLFAKSIGELYPVGRVGSVARDSEQMKQDNAARGASPASNAPDRPAEGAASKETNGSTSGGGAPKANDGKAPASVASIDPPDTRRVDEIVVWFDTDNLGSDQYGPYDKDFVWITADPAYSTWNGISNATAWNDNWETPHWDVWGYDDADELGLFDW